MNIWVYNVLLFQCNWAVGRQAVGDAAPGPRRPQRPLRSPARRAEADGAQLGVPRQAAGEGTDRRKQRHWQTRRQRNWSKVLIRSPQFTVCCFIFSWNISYCKIKPTYWQSHYNIIIIINSLTCQNFHLWMSIDYFMSFSCNYSPVRLLINVFIYYILFMFFSFYLLIWIVCANLFIVTFSWGLGFKKWFITSLVNTCT